MQLAVKAAHIAVNSICPLPNHAGYSTGPSKNTVKKHHETVAFLDSAFNLAGQIVGAEYESYVFGAELR